MKLLTFPTPTCTCGKPATWHYQNLRSVCACQTCARQAGIYDGDILKNLAERISQRRTGRLRTETARRWHSLRPRRRIWTREKRDLIYRWLRRYVGGLWYKGGHHVGRPNGGPMIYERSERLGQWLSDMRA